MSDDFLQEAISAPDKQVLSNLKELGEKLKELKTAMLMAQAKASKAEKEYEHFANVVLPQAMYSVGVDSITLASGGKLSVKRNFYCQPNKNLADRKKIVEWLRANGGDYIVEHDATVAAEDIQQLSDKNIPFIENTTFNTQRLKSFIKDKLGVTTGVQQLDISDIPECVHFQEVTTVELDIGE